MPFAFVFGLAMESGAYDIVVRSQFGIIAWWLILLCVAVGAVPIIRITRHGWLILGVMAALVLWTALATLTWTDSTERSILEISRTVSFLGFLSLLLLLQGRDGLRRSIGGLAAAVTLVALFALASRFHPAWFDVPVMPEGFPVARLSHPLGYWNGLAALMAIGLPALIWTAIEARNMVLRGLSAAAIPLVILVIFLTASRGGVGAMAVSLVLLLILYPQRLSLAVAMLPSIVGSVLLIKVLNGYPELRDNLGGVAGQQGTEMTWVTFGVVLVVGLLAWVLQAKLIGQRIHLPEVSRGAMKKVGITLAAVATACFLFLLASGTISEQWTEFQEPVTHDPTVDRLSSIASGERYENWKTALEAGWNAPLTGAGPGTFEYLWARNGTGEIFVRDAHSLYIEAFGELGIPGFFLVLGLILIPIGYAIRGVTRRSFGERRPAFAIAASGMTAFAVGAAADWSWEMTVLVGAFFVYVAAVSGPDAEPKSGRASGPDFRLPLLGSSRVFICLGSVVALIVIYLPMLGTQQIRESQTQFRQGNLTKSLEVAEDSRSTNPWSASAAIQVALLQYEAGDVASAVDAAQDAVDLDPKSWKSWFLLARFARADGKTELAEEAESKVIELNRKYRADADA